ncbi:hypothetical protein HK103_007702 [Boothiomyces macroporosus]|uniref:Uncharacterized protein n=1 Tax=Boothiomyces macroporosus TaxID=261099 RepID=A0AAD5Y1L8_9FUNG|nr:hypothetical protein HK103_007702 [Boothiomyces macroporosus]
MSTNQDGICPMIDSLIDGVAERSKYKKLVQYFQELTPEDVIESELGDFVSLVQPNHRILMNTFVNNYLQPYKDSLWLTKRSIEYQYLRFKDGMLDGSSYRILPSVASNALTINQTTNIKTKVQQLAGNQKIRFFDLSGNSLMSQDFSFVYELIDSLKDSIDDCIVNLENNRIHGYDEKYRNEVPKVLKKICEIGNIADYFEPAYQEASNVYEKLVWIPKFLLKGAGWRSLLGSDTTFHEKVFKVHQEFYREFDLFLPKKYSKEGWVKDRIIYH